jgi:hypothetical protein
MGGWKEVQDPGRGTSWRRTLDLDDLFSSTLIHLTSISCWRSIGAARRTPFASESGVLGHHRCVAAAESSAHSPSSSSEADPRTRPSRRPA